MEYSTDTQVKAAKYNLSFPDIMFARLLAAGCDLSDAYHAIYNKSKGKTTRNQAEAAANEILRVNPSITLLIQELNRKKPTTIQHAERNITEEEKERFTTRTGLIEEMIKNLAVTTGKDALQGITTLAKLQGLDKPDEAETEEKRRFFLPWVSHCRTCALMTLYKKVLKEKTQENGVK